MARYLVSNPCEDACATIETSRRVEGAPVYRCPGCDSEWIELHERTPPAPPGPTSGANPELDLAPIADAAPNPAAEGEL